MKKIFKFVPLITFLLLISSCKTTVQEDKLIDNSKKNSDKIINLEKNQIEIRFSCVKDNISKYTDDGWIIVKEYSEEKICTWKSIPSTKDCDMEKDKGCKITKPDKVGEEKIYLLEK